MKTIGIFFKMTLCICLLAQVFMLRANNIQIGKPSMFKKDASAGTLFIGFSLQWANSWKVSTPKNHDAAWVFVKYREGGNEWQHVYIETDNSLHSTKARNIGGNQADIKTTLKVGISNVTDDNDSTEEKGMGVFVYRTDNGTGHVLFDSINLKWNYVAQGLDESSILSLRVFAIEMVYIPQSTYLLGNSTYVAAQKNIEFSGTGGAKNIIGEHYGKIQNPGPGTWNVYGSGTHLSTVVGTEMESVDAWVGENKVINKPGATNGTWYRIRNPIGMAMYMEIPKHAWGTVAHVSSWSAAGSTTWSSAGYHAWNAPGYGNKDGWHTMRVKMPQPYKASFVYFSWSNSYAVTGFFARGSKDSINWVDLGGSTSTNTSYTGSQVYRVPLSNKDAYEWYEYNWYTNTYMICAAWGLGDETVGGDSANAYYYGTSDGYEGAPLSYRNISDGNLYSVDSAYPNGYEAFYIMKYELSQHAYVDFLNTLSSSQQDYLTDDAKNTSARGTRAFNFGRNYISLKEKIGGDAAIYGCQVKGELQHQWQPEYNAGNNAMNGLDWYCGAAYLCWSGLRPLTELEYEKACRGGGARVQDEYAWGTASRVDVTGAPASDVINKFNEIANPSNANFIPQGADAFFPMRVGCLATATSTRTDAGASFYGVLNLSDNVSEAYVNISTPEGRKYSGEHGSGFLNGQGAAVIENWPSNTTAIGLGIRGGYGNGYYNVANRYYMESPSVIDRASVTTDFTGNRYIGLRGGRTAPK